MTSPLIRVEKFELLSPAKVFLQNLSFDLEAGEILFLKGPNGSGKTTLLREMFSQLSHKRRSSRIQVQGVKSFSYLPQNLNREFFIPLSLGEMAQLAQSTDLASSVLQALLPGRIAERMWNVASGGEKQRAVLAQALSKQHSLYLLDEPFNHLDKNSVEIAAQAVAALADLGASFLIATHTVPQCLEKNVKSLSFKIPEGRAPCH